MPSIKRWLPLFLMLTLVLSACNLPVGDRANVQPTDEQAVVMTAAAQTVVALLTSIPPTQAAPTQAVSTPVPATQAPPPTAAVQPTVKPLPSLTPNVSNPTAAALPCDRAAFVDDITIPDGTILSPNATFTKTWRLKNNGSCEWNSSYKMVFTSGDAMGAEASYALPGKVAPGGTVDLSVTLKAPGTPKTYQGEWKLENASGQKFGVGSKGDKAFWVKVVVGGTPTLTYFAVTGVQVTASPATHTGSCTDLSLKLSAKITTSSAGTVTYYWERNDGFRTKKDSAEFDKGSSKTITTSVAVDGSYEGSWRLYVDDPNHQFFGPVAVKIVCE